MKRAIAPTLSAVVADMPTVLMESAERSARARRELRALKAVARLCQRFVREDPERPGDLLWGIHCNREGAEGGMDPDLFSLAMDRALSRLTPAPARKRRK